MLLKFIYLKAIQIEWKVLFPGNRVLMLFIFTICQVFFVVSAYCQTNIVKPLTSTTEEILTIHLDEIVGGELGGETHLTVTQDSILLDSWSWSNKVKRKIHIPHQVSSGQRSVFNDLISSIDLKEFRAIKSSPSELPTDGADKVISIKTTTGSYQEVNGVLIKKTKKFSDKLDKLIGNLLTHF